MNEILWWFIEPFTKPRYEITALDEFKIILCVLIVLGVLFLIGFGIAALIAYIEEKNKKVR